MNLEMTMYHIWILKNMMKSNKNKGNGLVVNFNYNPSYTYSNYGTVGTCVEIE